MADFLAIKKLAGSDLGWFRPLFHRFANTNLKGINLNADVLIEEFYRDLPVIANSQGGRIMVDVTIYGPGAAGPTPGSFKIVRSPKGKNRRLNGTLVNEPPDEPGRFDVLQPADLAVLAFDGRPVPTDIRLVLLAANAPEDAVLHSVLMRGPIGARRKSMATIDEATLRVALATTGVPAGHPLRYLLDLEDAQDLEDFVQGGISDIRLIVRRRAGRSVSRKELRRAKQAAEETGQLGEELVSAHFDGLRNASPDFEFEWVSERNAIAPYDFTCRQGVAEFVADAKSTRGTFDTNFHMSLAEIIHAADSAVPYLIYRVYELTEDGGKLCTSEDIRTFARELRAKHDMGMPQGVTADSFSVPVDTPGLAWSPPLDITFGDDTVEQDSFPLPTR